MEYPHWQYFLSLVEDVERLSRYVSLNEENFGTSSIECTRLLLSACSEIDVVCKVLCERVSPGSDPGRINEYGEIMLPRFRHIPTILICVPRFSLQFQPWEDWTTERRPDWWQDYNKVKHERHRYADLGNLGNVLNAVGGLCVLVSYLHYHDFISKGLATRRPFLFLDSLYNGEGSLLVSPKINLPDFAAVNTATVSAQIK